MNGFLLAAIAVAAGPVAMCLIVVGWLFFIGLRLLFDSFYYRDKALLIEALGIVVGSLFVEAALLFAVWLMSYGWQWATR